MRELEVSRNGLRVKVSKGGAYAVPVAPPTSYATSAAAPAGSAPAGSPAPNVIGPSAPAARNAKEVVAPLTGIFYRSSSPQAPAYVQVGSTVNVGDIIGLIEAMKLFNEIRSTAAGRVVRIVADNGQLVRAQQPLIEVE